MANCAESQVAKVVSTLDLNLGMKRSSQSLVVTRERSFNPRKACVHPSAFLISQRTPKPLACALWCEIFDGSMKVKVLQIVWHNKEPVFSVDFHPSGILATGGADSEIKVRLEGIEQN